MKTIVIGYDETDPARRALDRAAALGRAFGAHLVVTSVVPLAPASPRGGIEVEPDESLADHQAELARALDVLHNAGLEAELVAAIGDPAEAIVELARTREADLIIVGSRALNPIQRLLGQSVSGPVVRHAPCDVLIVH
jgi:nucleotide-binding universal stress UspA family protein